jgi:cell division septal protein FtsQ
MGMSRPGSGMRPFRIRRRYGNKSPSEPPRRPRGGIPKRFWLLFVILLASLITIAYLDWQKYYG